MLEIKNTYKTTYKAKENFSPPQLSVRLPEVSDSFYL